MKIIQIIIAFIGTFYYTTGAIQLVEKEYKEKISFYKSSSFRISFGLTLSFIAIKLIPLIFSL